MKLNWKLNSLVALCAVSFVPLLAASQDAEPGKLRLMVDSQDGGLKRVYVPDEEAPPQVDREAWARRVTVNDLDEREAHVDELIRRAATDDHLRLMLEEWAVDATQQERAWTARMALRELRRGVSTPTAPQVPGRINLNRIRDLQRELEDALFRLHDPHFGGWLQHFGRDLNQMFHQGSSNRIEESKSFQLEVAPNGVRCKLSECIDGEEVTQEYTADSYEELLEANPELREHLGQENGLGLEFGTFEFEPDFFFGLDSGFDPIDTQAPLRTDRLGIETTAPDADRVAKLGLQEGQGLLVVRVLPRSIASALGIRRGDLVVEMDSRPIFGGLDVRQVLSERAKEAELRVTVITSRGQRKELLWKPDF